MKFTTLVLAGGLLSLLYSSDSSFQAFGYLGAFALVCALVADLLFIPAACLLFARWRANQAPDLSAAKFPG